MVAHDGKAALAAIQQERPHLVFLDLHMPGMDGMEVLAAAKLADPTIKVIIITAIEDEQTIRKARDLGATDYVIKPFSLEYLKDEVLTKVSTSLYEDLRTANQELTQSLDQLRQVTRGIVSAFSMVVSKIDPHYTHEHVSRSVEYASKILGRLREKGISFNGLSEEGMLAGILLHDIGKIFTPKEILFKPGPLNDEEWRIMRRHPADGAEILEQIEGLKDIAKVVRYHQEAYDGSGYPEGLKGEEIPIGARIATAVDAFDAMTTDRPYRKGMTVAKAIEELKRNRGTQFDPMVVDTIVELYQAGVLKPAHLPKPDSLENDPHAHGTAGENGLPGAPEAQSGRAAPASHDAQAAAGRQPGAAAPKRTTPSNPARPSSPSHTTS